MKKIIFVFLLFMFMPSMKAACDYQTLADLKKVANNVSFTYDYKIKNDDATFKIRIANLFSNIYIQDSISNRTYRNEGSSDIVTKSYDSGLTLRFDIYASKGDCRDSLLTSKYVKLPYYNKYYSDAVCKGVSNYSLCERWSQVNLDYSTFYQSVLNYKKRVSEEQVTKEEEKSETIFDSLADFWVKYYYVFLPLIIIICIVVIVRTIKKDTFGF